LPIKAADYRMETSVQGALAIEQAAPVGITDP
jgi:hypothetical protein